MIILPLNIIGVPNAESQTIVFSWSQIPLLSECQMLVHYNILASKCGTCPTTTTLTSVICTDTPTDGGVCTFAVEVVVCETISGEYDIVNVNLSYYYYYGATSYDVDVRSYVALASACFFAALFIVSIAFVSLCMLRLKRRTKTDTALELPTAANIQGTLRSAENITATTNIAYEHNNYCRFNFITTIN